MWCTVITLTLYYKLKIANRINRDSSQLVIKNVFTHNHEAICLSCIY